MHKSSPRRAVAHRLTLSCAAVAALALAACGGGGGGDGGTVAPAGTRNVAGVLVLPSSTTGASERLMIAAVREVGLASAACPEVPDGYDPVASTEVRFQDAAGAPVSTLTTDACGRFSGFIPVAAVQAVATPTGANAISQPVASLEATTPVVISSLPAGASYVLSVVQFLGGDKLAISVTDSLTGKAVLGLTAADFSVAVAGSGLAMDALTYGSSLSATAASVSVVLDGSGSMSTIVTGTTKSQEQIAAIAAHELLNGFASGTDEAGVVAFGTTVKVVNDAVTSAMTWVTPAGASRTPYTFSASGLTTKISDLRPVIDLYNSRSKIYYSNRNSTVADEVHPDTGDWRVSSGSLPGGVTAFYDATSAGITLLDSAKNSRRLVVAMTDGQDNASSKKLPDVVAEAKAKGIPVYAVAVGKATDVDEADMQSLAQQTGGDYRRVEGTSLTGAFQGIQTGIRFQYLADMGANLASGSLLQITVARSGATATRNLQIP